MMFFFFFSSRRRHTRFDCDWSSDVCSSDLDHVGQHGIQLALSRHAILGPDRLEAVVPQVDSDQLRDGGLVLDDEDHGHLLHPLFASGTYSTADSMASMVW